MTYSLKKVPTFPGPRVQTPLVHEKPAVITVSGWRVAVAGGVVEAWSVSVGCTPVGVEVGTAGEPVGVLVDCRGEVGVRRKLLLWRLPVVVIPTDAVAPIIVVATRIRKPNIKLCLKDFFIFRFIFLDQAQPEALVTRNRLYASCTFSHLSILIGA